MEIWKKIIRGTTVLLVASACGTRQTVVEQTAEATLTAPADLGTYQRPEKTPTLKDNILPPNSRVLRRSGQGEWLLPPDEGIPIPWNNTDQYGNIEWTGQYCNGDLVILPESRSRICVGEIEDITGFHNVAPNQEINCLRINEMPLIRCRVTSFIVLDPVENWTPEYWTPTPPPNDDEV